MIHHQLRKLKKAACQASVGERDVGSLEFSGAVEKSSIGSAKPLTAYRPIEWQLSPPRSALKRADISSEWPVAPQSPWIRLTRLTSRPITVKSSRRPEPILP